MYTSSFCFEKEKNMVFPLYASLSGARVVRDPTKNESIVSQREKSSVFKEN